jgi:hypothetical protein
LAFAGDYVRLTTTHGLEVEAEIVATQSDGFRVRTVQGVWTVPYEDLFNYDTLGATLPSTTTWSVVLMGDAGPVSLARTLFEGLPALDVQSIDTPTNAGQLPNALAACGADVACLAEAHDDQTWTWFVHVHRDEDTLVFTSQQTTWNAAREERGSLLAGPAAVYGAAARALGLEAPEQVPEDHVVSIEAQLAALQRPSRPTLTPKRVAALSFAPVPGLPSLLQRDYAGFAGAMLTTAGLTTAFVAASGVTSTKRSEHVLLSIFGAYASSVCSSQLFGHLTLKRSKMQVAVTPQFDKSGIGGVALQLHMTPHPPRRRHTALP